MFVVEVIVTHAPDKPASALYQRLGLPTVLIWPTWEFLAELRDGLPVRFNRRSGTGRYELVGLRCSFPRHPAPNLGKCGDCDAERIQISAERSVTGCYKCRRQGPILDLVARRGGRLFTIAAGCPDLHGVEEVALRHGVRLRWDHSQTAGGSYLMHVCPHCSAKQGDNFLYRREGELDLSAPVYRYAVCAKSHWHDLGDATWPTGSAADRAGRATGLVGEPGGVFARSSLPQVHVRQGSSALTEFTRKVRGGW